MVLNLAWWILQSLLIFKKIFYWLRLFSQDGMNWLQYFSVFMDQDCRIHLGPWRRRGKNSVNIRPSWPRAWSITRICIICKVSSQSVSLKWRLKYFISLANFVRPSHSWVFILSFLWISARQRKKLHRWHDSKLYPPCRISRWWHINLSSLKFTIFLYFITLRNALSISFFM